MVRDYRSDVCNPEDFVTGAVTPFNQGGPLVHGSRIKECAIHRHSLALCRQRRINRQRRDRGRNVLNRHVDRVRIKGSVFVGRRGTNRVTTWALRIHMHHFSRVTGDHVNESVTPVDAPLADGIIARITGGQAQRVGRPLIHLRFTCDHKRRRHVLHHQIKGRGREGSVAVRGRDRHHLTLVRAVLGSERPAPSAVTIIRHRADRCAQADGVITDI